MRILLVKLSAIGDVVHTLPAAAYLRRVLPDANLSWAVERRAAAILKDSPVIDRLLELDSRALRNLRFAANPFAAVREQLAPEQSADARFDIAIDFQGLLKSALVAYSVSATRRVGFETAELREPLSRHLLTEQVKTASIAHVIDKNLALARAVAATISGETASADGATSDTRYEFPIAVSPADDEQVEQRLDGRFQRFAILNPGGGWATKLWGAANFGALADCLWQQHRLPSLVTYGPGEEALAEAVKAASRENAAQPFASTLKQFVALARRAALFVGGDTGPLHLAAACQTPIVGLYGPTAPQRNGPFAQQDLTVGRDLWCRDRCHRRRCWHWECMAIPVETVMQAVAARLSAEGKEVLRNED